MKKTILISLLTVFLAVCMSLGANALDKEKRTEYSSAGDINADGSVKGNDATMLLKKLADWKVDINEYFSDCTGDGKVKGNDATLLLKFLADWDVQPKLYRDFYNLLDYSDEIKNDGSFDITSCLTACLEEHDNVFIPDGTYLLTGTLTLKNGQGVKGGDDTVFMTNGQTVFTANGKYIEETDEIDFVNNIFIGNFKIVSGRVSPSPAVNIVAASEITVEKIRVEKQQVFEVNSCKPGFGSLEGKENFAKFQSHNFIVSDCSGDGEIFEKEAMVHGMIFHACRDFIVRDSKLEHYANGIMWWGGEPQNAGWIGKISDGLFYNVTVSDVQWGGIWGPLGRDLTLKKCTIINCDDVGCDMEGCRDCLVTECYFKDSVYNFGAPDQFAGNVTFSYNTSVQTDANKNLLHFDGHSCWDVDVAHDTEKIFIEHNTFITEGKVGLLGATYFCHGPVLGHLYLRDNEFVNTVYSSVVYPESVTWEDAEDLTYRLDLWEQVIEGNTFTFDLDEGNPFKPDYLVDYYPGVININANNTTDGAPCINIVRDNKIEAKAGIFSCGIWIEHGATARDYEVTCTGNEISSIFDNGIAIVNEGENGFTVDCENNICDSIVIIGDNVTVNESGNVSNSGRSVTAEQ